MISISGVVSRRELVEALEAASRPKKARDEARAEVERLKQKMACDMYDEAAASDAIATAVMERDEENARLRAALAVYADEEFYNFADDYGWRASNEPWTVAQAALAVEREA